MRARTALATALLALCVAVPAAGQQRYAPAVAFDGTTYLVVWEEQRPAASRDIYAARVSEAGVVLDPVGIPISKAAGDQRAPAVAFDGSSFVVVWQDDRSPSTGPDVYGARVSAAGLLLDPGGIPISAAPGVQLEAAITGTGSGSLVVWTEGGAASDIRGARVSSAGTVLDPGGLTVSAGTGAQLDPAAAFGGAGSLVVWEDHRSGSGADLYAARVSSAGAVLDPAGIAVAAGAGDERNGAVAVDGAAFLAAWDVASDVQARRVSAAGALLGSGPSAVAAAPGSQTRPALAFDGVNFLAAWQDELDLDGVRVSPDGGVLVPVSAISTAPLAQQRAAVAPGTSGLARRLGGRTRRRRQVGRLRCARFAGRHRARRGRDPDSTGPRPTGAADAHHARPAGPPDRPGSDLPLPLERGGLDVPVPARPQPLAGLPLAEDLSRPRPADAPVPGTGARPRGKCRPLPASREWRVDNPIPGLLHVVGGRSRRSGPGPLRRYTVQVEDGIQVDRRKVADTIASILGDRRGWGGTGRLSFQRVSSGPVSFRVVLATPSTVNRLCAPLITGGIYSCGMYGRAVLNLLRWRHGAPAFHGDMTKYRRYLVNHEVGHLLGHSHTSCHASGARAPVMMQQTKGVGSCRANGWPLAWERG